MQTLVIANPISGRGRARRRAEALIAELTRLSIDARLEFTKSAGDARRIAAELPSTVDRVVGVGGDGTLHEVIAGLANLDVKVGMLPTGTANILACELRLPRNPAACAAVVAAGRTVPFDIARANGERFFLVAGVGFDAACAAAVNSGRTKSIRMSSYVLPIIKEVFGFRHPHMRVIVEDEHGAEIDCHDDLLSLVVGNVRAYGGPFEITSYAHHASGDLELAMIRGKSALTAMPGVMLHALARLAPLARSITTRTVTRFRVESRAPVPYQLDGDPRGFTPVSFEMTNERLLVLAPAGTR